MAAETIVAFVFIPFDVGNGTQGLRYSVGRQVCSHRATPSPIAANLRIQSSAVPLVPVLFVHFMLETKNTLHFQFVLLCTVCVHMHVLAMAHVWSSEGNLQV